MDDAEKKFVAELIIHKHGFVPLGFVLGVTTEQLVSFAKELEEKNPIAPEWLKEKLG